MTIASDIHTVLDNRFMQVILTLFVAVVVQVIIGRVLAGVVRSAVRRHKHASRVEEMKRENTLISFSKTLSIAVIWLVTGIIILSEFHINIAALLTGAGLVGIVVGMGAQNIIKDYLAGVLIIVENQYRVGDIVMLQAGGTNVSGAVEDISIRATRLRDLDGRLHIVPNGSAGVITNMSLEFAQVNVDVGVGYDSNIDLVEKIINKVGSDMAKDEPWSENILQPIKFLRVDNFADSSIVVKSVGRVKPATQWDVAGEFRRRLKAAFDEQGIQIPLPQVVIHEAKTARPHKSTSVREDALTQSA